MNDIFIQNYITISPGKLCIDGEERHVSDTQQFKEFIRDVYKQYSLNYPKFFKMDDLSKLGFIAAELLLSNFDRSMVKDEEIALLFSNSESTLNTDKKFYDSIASVPSPAVFVYTLPNIMMGEISIRHSVKGENAFYITEHFDSILLSTQVETMFNHTKMKACICGWVDFVDETEYKAYLTLLNKFEGNNKSIIFTTQNFQKLYSKG